MSMFHFRAGTALRRAACLGLLAAMPSAFAHYLWLESEPSGARLYFGEVNEVREQSPGRLDEITAPRVLKLSAGGDARELPSERRRGAFALSGAKAAPHLAAIETGYEVRDWTRQGIGIVKPMFYARWSPWPAREPVPSDPALRLDVQPLPAIPGVVQVLLDGQRLPAAKLVVHAPNGWDHELQADARGQVRLALPWRGQYVLEVIHKDGVGGDFQGRHYDAIRHRATLTIVQRRGIDPAGTGSLAPRHPDR